MANRTGRGNLQLADSTDTDSTLTIDSTFEAGIGFLAVDRDSDQRAFIYLNAERLDELAAEILRIREERGI